MAAHRKGTHITGKSRLSPPANLSPSAAAIFESVVAAVDPTHFSLVDMQLVSQYAGAADLAAQAQARLDQDGAVVDGRASPWLQVLEKASRSCVALSARLRICPQSRFDRLVAGANSREQPQTRKPWEAGYLDGDELLA